MHWRNTYPATTVPNHKYEPAPLPPILITQLIQAPQARPILLQTIRQPPPIHQLQSRGHQQPNLLRKRFTQQPRLARRAVSIPVQHQRCQRRRLEGREPPLCGLGSVEHAAAGVRHGAVVVCAEGSGERGRGVVLT